MLTLDLIVATLGLDGIKRVETMLLPPMPGINYIVSWQKSDGIVLPEAIASRKDVKVYRLEGVGLSRNRNNALDRSEADIALIADDDLQYTPEQLRSVAEAFASRPDLDVAFFRYDGPGQRFYPLSECPMDPLPKGYYITAFEMALRRCGATAGLRYDERFGLGSGCLTLGEEDELLHRVVRQGLTARFIPLTITTHPHLTSGLRALDARAQRAQGAIIKINYPWTWPLRVPLKAWRNFRQKNSPLSSGVLNGFRGALWAIFRY